MNQYTRWILISVMAMLCDVASAADWIRTDYSLRGVLTGNQVRRIEKDKNGFYWILSASGWLVRWNGSNFFNDHLASNVITPAHRFWTSVRTADNELYWIGDGAGMGQLYKVNDESRIVPWPVPDGLVTRNCFYNGDLFLFPKPDAADSNADRSDTVLLDCKQTKIQAIYTAGANSFYAVSNEFVYYFEGGRLLKKITVDLSVSDAFVLDDYLVVWKGDAGYELYGRGEIVYTETKAVNKPYVSFINTYKRSGKNSYAVVNSAVCRFFISGQRVVNEEIAALSQEEGLQVVYDVCVDEAAGRILLAKQNGGFSVLRKNYFRFGEPANLLTGAPYYSLKLDEGKLVSNRLFVHTLMGEKNLSYDQTGPIIIHDKHFFYFSQGAVYELNKDFALLRTMELPSRGVTRNGFVYNQHEILFSDGLLLSLDTRTGKTKQIIPGGDVQKLTEKSVLYMTPGPDGFFFACYPDGVYRIDINGFNAQKIAGIKEINPDVRSISYHASLNVLFVTIRGHGVQVLPLNGNQLIELPVGDVYELKSCHYLLEDADGDFWMPTNFGLFLMLRADLKQFISDGTHNIRYFRFDKGDGLLNEEFNGGFLGSGIASADSFLLCNMHSYVSFRPKELKQSLFGMRDGRLIEGAVWVNDSLQLAGIRKIKAPPGFRKIVVQADWPDLGVQLGTIEFRLMNSSDTTWRVVPADNKVELRDLPGGRYRLEFRVVGFQETQYLSYDIEVQRYWYQRWWAYALYAFVLISLGLVVFQWRLFAIRNRSLEVIDENRRELFSIISRDLRSPIKTYQGLADAISNLVRNKEYEQVEKIAARIDATGMKLDLLLSNLLNWNLLQQQKMQPKKETLDIAELVHELAEVYRDIAAPRRITVSIEGENNKIRETDRNLLSLMIRNLLDNAVKYATKESPVKLTLQQEQEKLKLIISNEMEAADGEKVQQVARMLQEEKTWEPGSGKMGFGLKIVKMASLKTDIQFSLVLDEREVHCILILK